MVGAGTAFTEASVGSIESHAVPTTPRRIPNNAKTAITCTQVIRIFAIENELNGGSIVENSLLSRRYFLTSALVVRQMRGLVTYSSFFEKIQLNQTSCARITGRLLSSLADERIRPELSICLMSSCRSAINT